MLLSDHLQDFAIKLAKSIAPDKKGHSETGHQPDFVDSFRSFRDSCDLDFSAIASTIPDLRSEYMQAVTKLREAKNWNPVLNKLRQRQVSHKYVVVAISWILTNPERANLYWQHVSDFGMKFLDGFDLPVSSASISSEELTLMELADLRSFERINTPSEAMSASRQITGIEEYIHENKNDPDYGILYSIKIQNKYETLSRIRDYMIMNDHKSPFLDLIAEMTKWYGVAHWSNDEAHSGRFIMEPVVRIALATVRDFSNPHALELALQYAHSCKLMELHDNRRWIMEKIGKLTALPRESRARAILLQYTDGLLNSLAPHGAIAPESLLERMKVETPIVQASVWRCAACLTLSLRAYDETATHIQRARKAFNVATSKHPSSISDEDKIIPLYLDTIALISELETDRKVSISQIDRLNDIIKKVYFADRNATTFIVGLYDLQIQMRIRMEAGFNEPITYNGFVDRTGDLQTVAFITEAMKRAVKDFCFFDMRSIEQRIEGW